MPDNHFTLYLVPADRALLDRVGDALARNGVDVSAPDGTRSRAAVIRAALRIVDEQLQWDAELASPEGQAKLARMARDRSA